MSKKPEKSPMVHCPTCRKGVEWNDSSTWKPFCSERCSLIDLGEWFEEKPRIPGDPYLSDEDEY